MWMRNVCLLSSLMLAACGNAPLASDTTGKFLVTAKCTPATLTATVAANQNATLVVSFGPTTRDPLADIAAAGRSTPPFLIAVGAVPDDQGVIPDAVIVAETGAAAAVDLALLACNGIALPPSKFELGTRTVTPANLAAGGTATVAPGDAMLAMMHMQHAALLTTKPETDYVHVIGAMQTDSKDSWQTEVLAAIATSAARYPQIRLHNGNAEQPQSADPVELTRLLMRAGCRAILVATSNVQTTKNMLAAAALGQDGAVPIVVLDPALGDHATCSIGCSPHSLGQAAATMVKQLLPEGGELITCFGDGEDAANVVSQSRARGFCDAMAFPGNRLLGR
jgi:hypothetical protein